MCMGPSSAERAAMRQQRLAAEEAKRAEVEERARAKREDVTEAISGQNIQAGRRGGAGRRSLFTSMSGGAGYASRF